MDSCDDGALHENESSVHLDPRCGHRTFNLILYSTDSTVPAKVCQPIIVCPVHCKICESTHVTSQAFVSPISAESLSPLEPTHAHHI